MTDADVPTEVDELLARFLDAAAAERTDETRAAYAVVLDSVRRQATGWLDGSRPAPTKEPQVVLVLAVTTYLLEDTDGLPPAEARRAASLSERLLRWLVLHGGLAREGNECCLLEARAVLAEVRHRADAQKPRYGGYGGYGGYDSHGYGAYGGYGYDGYDSDAYDSYGYDTGAGHLPEETDEYGGALHLDDWNARRQRPGPW